MVFLKSRRYNELLYSIFREPFAAALNPPAETALLELQDHKSANFKRVLCTYSFRPAGEKQRSRHAVE